MAYSQDVKELAYVLDPVCWVSYSGKGRNFKAAMDARRTKALNQAQIEIDRIEERRRGHAWRQAEDQGVGLTHAEVVLAECYGG